MSVLLDTDSSMMITIERKKEQLPWSTLSWIWSGIRRFTFSEMVKDPVFLTGEIIQIGAIKLNQTLEVVDSFNERIAPQYYTELHPKVAEITKLSNRNLLCFLLKNLVISGVSAYQILKPYVLSLVFSLTG